MGGNDPSLWADVNTVMNVTANLKGRTFLRPVSDWQSYTFSSLLHEVSFDVPRVTTPRVITLR